MEGRSRALLAALLAGWLTFSAAPVAQAGGHMAGYVLTPEHDDTGRSDEPNFAGTTGILGLDVSERNVDANLDGQAEPHPVSASVAPGCTGSGGRVQSGLCFAAWRTAQLGLPPVGEQGRGCANAPGTFSNGCKTVRFMDLIGTFQPVRAYVDLNAKLQDSGAAALLGVVNPSLRNAFIPPSAGFTMWYGDWTDKNGNGVIDHDGTNCTPTACASVAEQARNEFTWRGACKTFTGGPSSVPPWVCTLEAPAEVLVWAYPGNHHASTNGATVVFSPGDLPGQQAMCFAWIISGAAALTAPVETLAGGTLIGCPKRIQDIDDNDDRLDIGSADPLLGPQGSLKPDFTIAHRTGDANINTRHMVAGLGWPMYTYDQSLLVTFTTIAAMDPRLIGPGQYDVSQSRFIDVDRAHTLSTEAESLLQGTVKPTLRGSPTTLGWVFVRDSYIPVNNFVDGRMFSGSTGVGAAALTLGSLDDAHADPGNCHEPNHPLDSYPNVVRGAASCDGSKHVYSGYRTAPRLWADGTLRRTEPLIRPGNNLGLPPPPVPAGPLINDGISPGARAPGDHSRSLSPGAFDFLGALGLWQDVSHVNVDSVFDPVTLGTVTTVYTSGPDGWVGNVVSTTGQWRYRDYQPTTCDVNGVNGLHEFAECNPYANGFIQDPNDYATDDGEMATGCGSVGSAVGTLELIPDGGRWSVPVFVYRQFEELTLGDLTQIEDRTNSLGPIVLNINCAGENAVGSRDYVFLPIGNPGVGVTTKWVAQTSSAPGQTVVDVDYYKALV